MTRAPGMQSPANVAAQLAKYEAMTTDALQTERDAQEAIAQRPVSEAEIRNMRTINPAVAREVASTNVRLIDQELAGRA